MTLYTPMHKARRYYMSPLNSHENDLFISVYLLGFYMRRMNAMYYELLYKDGTPIPSVLLFRLVSFLKENT